jgi:hypothetical protein
MRILTNVFLAAWWCSGKRDRAEYHSLQEFTDEHMHSDFHFLMDVERIANNAHREAYKSKLKVLTLKHAFFLGWYTFPFPSSSAQHNMICP